MPFVCRTSRSVSARACSRSPQRRAGADPLPSWNDGAGQGAHRRLRRRRSPSRARRTSCRRPSASPCSTTTARCGPSSRSTSSSPSRSTASRRWRRSTPSGQTTQPFKAVLEGDLKALLAGGEKGAASSSSMATHAGMTTDEFAAIVARLDRHRAAPEARAPLHRDASTSRCSSCSPTCAPTASRPTSSPAAASSSCAPWAEQRLRHPARAGDRQSASRRSTRCATASR